MTAVVVLVAVLAGALVVGPVLNRAVLAWVGENVVVPAVLGRPLADGEVAEFMQFPQEVRDDCCLRQTNFIFCVAFRWRFRRQLAHRMRRR